MTEATAQKIAKLTASRSGARVFRNNVGMAKDADGNVIRFGLAVGSSDLIGWQTVTVTPDMVGRPVAVFVSLEVKGPKGRASEAQKHWLRTVADAGGIAGVVRTAEDVKTLLSQPTNTNA